MKCIERVPRMDFMQWDGTVRQAMMLAAWLREFFPEATVQLFPAGTSVGSYTLKIFESPLVSARVITMYPTNYLLISASHDYYKLVDAYLFETLYEIIPEPPALIQVGFIC